MTSRITRLAMFRQLTEDETEVIVMWCEGVTIADISSRRSIAKTRVITELASVYGKLGLAKLDQQTRLQELAAIGAMIRNLEPRHTRRRKSASPGIERPLRGSLAAVIADDQMTMRAAIAPQRQKLLHPGSSTRPLTSAVKGAALTGYPGAEVVLAVSNVSYRYPNGTASLVDVSIDIRAGELVCLVGKSGCGKSTLLRILALDARPTTGKVTVLGYDSSLLSGRAFDDFRGEVIEYMPQGDFGVISRTAEQSIAHWLRNYDNMAAKSALDRARAALRTTGLPEDRFRHHIQSLSGGQMARVAIATAVSRRRPIWLADEIFGPFDEENANDLVGVLREYARLGITIVVIVHQLDLHPFFDRVISMDEGRIIGDTVNPTPALFQPTR